MTLYLCVSLIVVGMVLLCGSQKGALTIGLCAVLGGFGYRLYVGDELRSILADALFVVAVLPIGWWGARQLHGLLDAPQTTDNN